MIKNIFIEPFVDHEPIPFMAPKLQDEVWYHGSITRQHAEALLKHVSYTYIENNLFLYYKY